jgi:hypothetical protein
MHSLAKQAASSFVQQWERRRRLLLDTGEASDVHISLLPMHEMRRAHCVGRMGRVHVSAAQAGAAAPAASDVPIL